MPIKDIKEKILEESLEEKERIIHAAKENIKKMINQSQREIDALKKGILEQYEQEAELKEKKIITEARLDSRKNILFEKQSIIDEIFREASKRILDLDKEKYLKLMEKLILSNLEQGDETIYTGSQDHKRLNQSFIDTINQRLKSQGKKGELKLSEKHLPIRGGVILGTEEIRKNASFEIILERIREVMETDLSQFLFNENEG